MYHITNIIKYKQRHYNENPVIHENHNHYRVLFITIHIRY